MCGAKAGSHPCTPCQRSHAPRARPAPGHQLWRAPSAAAALPASLVCLPWLCPHCWRLRKHSTEDEGPFQNAGSLKDTQKDASTAARRQFIASWQHPFPCRARRCDHSIRGNLCARVGNMKALLIATSDLVQSGWQRGKQHTCLIAGRPGHSVAGMVEVQHAQIPCNSPRCYQRNRRHKRCYKHCRPCVQVLAIEPL